MLDLACASLKFCKVEPATGESQQGAWTSGVALVPEVLWREAPLLGRSGGNAGTGTVVHPSD
eukprot:CAMPEP_0194781858 /NCGR_PEP_ID=MMETSP0323_2-20130528/77454_1 /TAXON_ID=2866 ORGANISM="Crypthecodinium cohnii, Strain Seligo" /NCGR_SAMPLE_ID=MMETSP0323_2 /ASSEMBLY_ACC=CAM_ASM_000346 /LENGTH=61 /DNA_ID=CAMNT_0039720475 /DNA_START=360 /DNA_END=545 /DNA_ORIENTATION=+